jgi:hypothetical protein
MDDIFNVHLPTSPNRVVSKKPPAKGDIVRVGMVTDYTNKGFTVSVNIENDAKSVIIPNKILNLLGSDFYSLPANNKHLHWYHSNVVDGVNVNHDKIIRKYWSNLKPGVKVIVHLNKKLNVTHYESYATT